jgi:hypothetical protein
MDEPCGMATAEGTMVLVLQEFRLARADTDGTVARIVGSLPSGAAPAVPLLISIEDRRNVAIIRALNADESHAPDAAHIALDPFVASWREPTKYSPRISERSQSQPSSFRLAVTESGINDAASEVMPIPVEYDASPSHLGLLWVGEPIGTHAGLLVLVGNNDDPSMPRPAARQWPLPLSRLLGVRIYEGG